MDRSFNCMQQACSGPLTTVNYFLGQFEKLQKLCSIRQLRYPGNRYQFTLLNEGNVAITKSKSGKSSACM